MRITQQTSLDFPQNRTRVRQIVLLAIIVSWLLGLPQLSVGTADVHPPEIVFPGQAWSQRCPEELGLEVQKLDELATRLGGRGCVIRHGHDLKT